MVAVCGFRHGEPTEEKPFTSLRRKSGRFGKDFADDQGDRGGDGDGDDGDGDGGDGGDGDGEHLEGKPISLMLRWWIEN